MRYKTIIYRNKIYKFYYFIFRKINDFSKEYNFIFYINLQN
jgi:hypothetical protein